MKHLLEIDDKEMDCFVDIFLHGISAEGKGYGKTGNRLVNRILKMAQKYEDGIKVGVK